VIGVHSETIAKIRRAYFIHQKPIKEICRELRISRTLRQRELASVGAKLAAESGLPHHAATEGASVSGVYRQRLNLASGRFAMIDDGLGFSLVPWSPSLERELGKHVSGVTSPDGGVRWSFGPKRELGL